SIYHEAGNQDNSDERRKITKHAIQSESDQRRKAMVHLAQSEPGVAINLSNLDADPWLINCAKGTIDLHTGTLYPHSREDLLTVLIPVTYDPIAECPRWIEFLNTVMGGDQELIDYLQRAVGYSLTGDTRSQIVFFLHGLGSNGKSTFLLIIRKMLGGYGAKADSSVFMINDSKSGGPTEGLANLHGKRFVIASEVEDKQRLSVRLIKDMTGGEPIVANRKYEHEVEFQPTHKIWLCGNHKPVISDTTYSIWRRMKLIPFSVTITEVDEQLPMKLESELPGILRWAIEGCLEWQRQGLNEPQGVASATETYRQEQDILFEFLDDRCVKHPLNTVTKKDLCEAYGDWCQGTGTKAVGPRTFTNRLREKGFEEGKSGSNRFWKGIGLIGTDGTEGADNSGKFLNKANNENFLENTAPSVPSVPNPIETCANCQGTDFWMRADGTKLCNRCHPKP
ncbi:MAG: DNA primase, partial [Chloroflexi bacterium]|nr:DNA primase [Chloroflexota bacterium]